VAGIASSPEGRLILQAAIIVQQIYALGCLKSEPEWRLENFKKMNNDQLMSQSVIGKVVAV
jgi:hypothetical protein